MENINFKQEIINLEFGKSQCLDELITLFKHNNVEILEANKTRALSKIDLMIRIMEELKEKI